MTIKKPIIGLIGLGIMGQPMAIRLLHEGYTVIGFARTKSKAQKFCDNGGQLVDSCEAVGKLVDILITNVTDSPEVNEVLFGQSGAATTLKSNALVIDMSTISPIECQKISDNLKEKNIRMLDAPVSGGDIGAKQGTLSIMVGGIEDDFNEALPIFNILGEKISYQGGCSTGQLCKSCNQMMVAQVLNAVSETLNYAEKTGANLLKVREALLGGYASSKILEVHGLKMINQTYQPGFKTILHNKDLNIVKTTCEAYDIASPATDLAHQQIAQVIQLGKGNLDNSAIHLLHTNNK